MANVQFIREMFKHLIIRICLGLVRSSIPVFHMQSCCDCCIPGRPEHWHFNWQLGRGLPALSRSPGRSQDSSNGYSCCTARSRCEVPVRNFAPRTTPSRPLISSATIPTFHFPRFLSSDLVSTTSPTLGLCGFPEFFRL